MSDVYDANWLMFRAIKHAFMESPFYVSDN